MMTLAVARAKCLAGGGPLERRVRHHCAVADERMVTPHCSALPLTMLPKEVDAGRRILLCCSNYLVGEDQVSKVVV